MPLSFLSCTECTPYTHEVDTPINAVLVRQIFEQIRLHPEEWDQASFVCGTSHCFGGWAVALTRPGEGSLYYRAEGDVEKVAREALGLTPREAEHLFYCCASVKELHEMQDQVEILMEARSA